MKSKILAVVGPTASGKTGLAIELAKAYNGEVVSADSMQIYKGMTIATAKPSEQEMQGIPHHLIDFLDADKTYSVGQYVIDAEKAVSDIISRDKLPILCGGTGLYVDSFLNGIDFIDNSSNDVIRKDLELMAEEKGVDFMLEKLASFDPTSAEKLEEQKNLKRIIRAIEFYMVTGITISEQNEKSRLINSKYEHIIIGLTASDRQYLYDRINKRVDRMIEQGLVEEAREVLSSSLSDTSSKAIGYKQLIPYFNGTEELEACVERIKMETRRYAKRQLTWFKRNENIIWINIDECNTDADIAQYAKKLICDRGFLNG